MDSPLKWHGGKHYLTDWLWHHAPPRDSYTHVVDACFGSGAFLLAGPPGKSEVGNDIHGDLVNFFRALSDPARRVDFIDRVSILPMSQELFESGTGDRAVDFFLRIRQSYQGQGKSYAPRSRARTRGGRNEQVNAWRSAVDGLTEVSDRLLNVNWLNLPVIECIEKEDGPHTFFYIDPPYLPSTRKSPDVYQYEMTARDHVALLSTLRRVRGRVMLSSYPSAVYAAGLQSWNRTDKRIDNKTSATREIVTECIWRNYG